MTSPNRDSHLVAVSLPSEADISRAIGGSYDPRTTLNVIKMFAGTEDMFPAVAGFIKSVFHAAGVDPKLREMIALRVAAKYHVAYEWQAQATLARNVCLKPVEIEAAASDDAATTISAEYILVFTATDELCIEGTLRDETLSQLLTRYGEPLTRKLILIISWFNLLSCFINGCRVPPETTDKIGHGVVPVN
jgi:alkylhydroperoxidase family enzyme